MALKNHADATAHLLPLAATGTVKTMTEHSDVTGLHRAQGTNQGQQRCLAATGWPRQQHHLAGIDPEADALQHLPPHLTATVGVAEVLELDGGHQKISAGSASTRRRIASSEDSMHITRIMPPTVIALVRSIPTGSFVASRTNQYSP